VPTISASWPVASLATRTIFGYRPAPAVALALLLAALLVAGCGSTSPWRTVNSPTTWGLSSIAMVSASEGWAVGNNGTILHYAGGQ
jgi:photosystem II stability/assembly factor-like uncharacterized protein